MMNRFAVLPSGWAPNSGPAPIPSPIDGQPAPAGPTGPAPAPAGPAPAGPAPSAPAAGAGAGAGAAAVSGPLDGKSAREIRRLRYLARFKKLGKPAVKGLGRMLLGEAADKAYGWMGMGDEANMTAAMERLITDNIVGEGPDQISDEEAADWLSRGSYEQRQGAGSRTAELGLTMTPQGFWTDMTISPFVREFGIPFTDTHGIRDLTRSNEQIIRNVQMAKQGRHQLLNTLGKDGKPIYSQRDIDLQFGPLPDPKTYFPLNSDNNQMNFFEKVWNGEPDNSNLDQRIDDNRARNVPKRGY